MVIRSIAALSEWLNDFPKGTLLTVDAIRDLVAQIPGGPPLIAVEDTTHTMTWRERLWTVPQDTRIGSVELAQALGKSRSWVYHRTQVHSAHIPLPHRRIDNGQLEFVVREIRLWLTQVDVVCTPEL
jgi:predicted DNA-binding transcriptional regulator AlpA